MPFVSLLTGAKHFGAYGFRQKSAERAGALDGSAHSRRGTTT